MNLFKEIQTLSWLGIRANVKLRITEDITRSCYIKATNHPELAAHVHEACAADESSRHESAAEYHQNVRDLIAQAIREKLTWQNVTLSSLGRGESSRVGT